MIAREETIATARKVYEETIATARKVYEETIATARARAAKWKKQIQTDIENYEYRITALEKDIGNHEIRIKALEARAKHQQQHLENHEDRIGELEEVALILRAKLEPETLTTEAIERAETIAKEREEQEPC